MFDYSSINKCIKLHDLKLKCREGMKIKEPEWWIGVVGAVGIGNVRERIEERELRTDQPEKGCLPWGRWRRRNFQNFQTIFKGFTSPLGFFHCSFQSLFILHSFFPHFCLSSFLPFYMVYKRKFCYDPTRVVLIFIFLLYLKIHVVKLGLILTNYWCFYKSYYYFVYSYNFLLLSLFSYNLHYSIWLLLPTYNVHELSW